ncbi:MAG: tRNA 4-thiouridine(8) synthase ThiI [bacterium]|nr:tRNA 4-thiouridine(8) synthase ThiI [bacterium]
MTDVTTPPRKVRGISLFSGGLDSMLAVCVLRDQGIEMDGLVFKSPFFSPEGAIKAAKHLGITLHILDFTETILGLVRNPPHGFGGAMNPCIDCHANMIAAAGAFMREHGYDFVSTGEVLNQRPMSQNRRSLDTVAKSSGLEGYLIRPLSAQLLDPSIPEQDGRVDRSRLCAIQGRNRQPQMELVQRFGIKEFPSPAGGCLLTEKGFCRKLRDLFDHTDGIPEVRDVELMKYPRQFRLPDGGRIIVGRNRDDNKRLKALAAKENRTILHTVNIPGPTALVIGEIPESDLQRAAAIISNYGDKGALTEIIVKVITPTETKEVTVQPLPRETYEPWML